MPHPKMLAFCLLSCLAASPVRADEASANEKEVHRLASVGRYGEAERLSRGLVTPTAKAYRAKVISRDSPLLRQRGVSSFDPKLSASLAAEALPALRARAAADPLCANALAGLYFAGVGVKADKAVAFRWYLSAARRGHGSAMTTVGICYLEGDGVPEDAAMALAWLKRGATAGDPYANYVLGRMCEDGNGVPASVSRAVSYYEKAADDGSVDGMVCCAWIAYHRADKALNGKDFRAHQAFVGAAEKWFRAATEAGDSLAKDALKDVEKMKLLADALIRNSAPVAP